MVKSKTSLILVTALLLLSSAAVAQTTDDSNSSQESDLGEGVLAYNFVMRGLPASDGEEVDVERSFEVEADENENENFSVSQDEAVQTALDELGSSEWELDEAEQSEGLYELTFVRGESEAEVSVDGSTGTIVEFDAEVEYEPLEEASAVLSGFVEFSNDRFELDTDIEVNEEDNTARFEVEIEEDGDLGSDVVTRRSIREFEDAEPGQYTGVLEVVRDDEVVHTERQEFRVPGPVENDSESENEDSNEDENESVEAEDESQGLEEMSRQELIDEIRDLREEVERLRNQASDRGPETPPTPGDDSEENESDEDEDEQESEDTDDSESEESEDSNESEGPPSGAPGNSENRPGFVNRMLSGLFG